MSEIKWNLIDRSEDKLYDRDRLSIEINYIYKSIFRGIEGDIDEDDGHFEIELFDGTKLEYNYLYHPVSSGKDFFKLTKEGKTLCEFDFDLLSEQYFCNFGCIVSALVMYIDYKLGTLNHK